jgi:hypothetical protein
LRFGEYTAKNMTYLSQKMQHIVKIPKCGMTVRSSERKKKANHIIPNWNNINFIPKINVTPSSYRYIAMFEVKKLI